MEPPADVRAAFAKYAGGGALMTSLQLHQFMIHEQCQPKTSLKDAEAISRDILHARYHRSHTFNNNLTFDDFFHFLFSFELNPPIRSKVHQDMKLPLSHYFMFTGHNSYLTGNQINSPSSEVPVIEALKKGVRVIELDIWPNKAKDDVLVLHGGVVEPLQKPVKLVTCLKAIAQNAFSASTLPVIITFEDHLQPPLQAKVAEMLEKTLGNLLYVPKCDSERLEHFGSPESLRCKILISTKPPNEYLEANGREGGPAEDIWGPEPGFAPAGNFPYIDDGRDDLGPQPPRTYKSLIAFHSKKPRGGIVEALSVASPNVRRLSLSELTLLGAARDHGPQILRFTQKNILRVYPKGIRIDSSNYDPMNAWMLGAQMVAFNMQGSGRPLWLMQGMFRANGGLGYVKKPDMLMTPGFRQDLRVKKTLKVKVYMGDGWQSFLPTLAGPPNFYTKVGIYGVPADCVMEKTERMASNKNPMWQEEFSFRLTVPELALLRIEVHDCNMFGKNGFAGQTCLPVSELLPGFRAVPLHDHKGNKYSNAGLMMRFEFIRHV